ncbi:MAG: arginase family protein [Candidatus Heimdallarchaeota archaeon]
MPRKLGFFGCPLDPDEREAVIKSKAEKAKLGYASLAFKDPYDAMVHYLQSVKLNAPFDFLGKLDIAPWLIPAPEPKYLELLTVENVVAFIDANGCLEYATTAYRFVKEHVLAYKPVLMGVDHSLIGGPIRAIAETCGKSDLCVAILDSHLDAIIPTVRCGLIQYDVETNPESPFDPFDPFIRGRLDSYNADSFIYYLIHEGWVSSENVVVIGVCDYPPKAAFEIDDERVKRYVNLYTGFEKMGVKIIKKQELEENPSVVKKTLTEMKARNLYVSIDVDVGANSALRGARFLDYTGLSEDLIHKVLGHLISVIKRGVNLTGFDIVETDVHKASLDRTYQIELEIIKRFASYA